MVRPSAGAVFGVLALTAVTGCGGTGEQTSAIELVFDTSSSAVQHGVALTCRLTPEPTGHRPRVRHYVEPGDATDLTRELSCARRQRHVLHAGIAG